MPLFQKILVGVALDRGSRHVAPSSERAVVLARGIAEHAGAELTLFHSTWDDRSPPRVQGAVLLGGALPPEVSRALVPLRDDCERAGLRAGIELSDEPPWLAMTRRVLRGLNDLVVVARRDEEAPDGRRLGRNALELMRKCPSPVWVLHPRQRAVGRSILAATDLSPVGTRAVELGALLAGAWGAPLHVVHAFDVPYDRRSSLGAPERRREEVVAELEADARLEIMAALEKMAPGVEPELHVRPGRAAEVILERVEALDPDVLVAGTHSRSGMAGVLVGNTAEKLLGRVEASLLTVKPAGFASPVEPDRG